ncbi:chorismate mutase [Streptomyces qinglanensis]|uniref:Chorismate mutase n=1 Tax=Streptomyces qinglanensis TaxID=943816 RepID=A0A1H9VCD5_9ACTN|nr:chorismate mutase [Streptomyces qinglanensis]SES19345.1 chorismate mutase [Streptomyces qinglanensis]
MSATTSTTRTSTTTSAQSDPAPEAVIDAERARIDALDARIVALVRDRMEVSENIQRVRIDSGGRRVHLAREMQILDHYSTELGGPGRELARTLLRLCRGH